MDLEKTTTDINLKSYLISTKKFKNRSRKFLTFECVGVGLDLWKFDLQKVVVKIKNHPWYLKKHITVIKIVKQFFEDLETLFTKNQNQNLARAFSTFLWFLVATFSRSQQHFLKLGLFSKIYHTFSHFREIPLSFSMTTHLQSSRYKKVTEIKKRSRHFIKDQKTKTTTPT